MNKLVKEELDAMKYLLGYQRGKVISEQDAAPAATTQPPQTIEDVIKQIQTTLNTKYGTKLAVDGKWGNLTQTAFETALKSKGTTPVTTTGTQPQAAQPQAAQPQAAQPQAAQPQAAQPQAAQPQAAQPQAAQPQAAQPQAAQPQAAQPQAAQPQAVETPADVMGTEVAQPTIRDQRRERQDLRRSNRRAMQDLRTQQRAQQ